MVNIVNIVSICLCTYCSHSFLLEEVKDNLIWRGVGGAEEGKLYVYNPREDCSLSSLPGTGSDPCLPVGEDLSLISLPRSGPLS